MLDWKRATAPLKFHLLSKMLLWYFFQQFCIHCGEKPNLLQVAENNFLDVEALREEMQQRDSLYPDLSSVEDEVYFSTLLLQCKEIKQVVELIFVDGVLMEEDLVLQQSLFTLPPVKDAPLVGFHHRPYMIDLINFVMFFSPFPFVQTIPCGHLPYMANYVPNVTVIYLHP